MNMIKQISTLHRIIDLQREIIEAYKEIIRTSHAEEELGMIELDKKCNMVAALLESVGVAP